MRDVWAGGFLRNWLSFVWAECWLDKSYVFDFDATVDLGVDLEEFAWIEVAKVSSSSFFLLNHLVHKFTTSGSEV